MTCMRIRAYVPEDGAQRGPPAMHAIFPPSSLSLSGRDFLDVRANAMAKSVGRTLSIQQPGLLFPEELKKQFAISAADHTDVDEMTKSHVEI